MTVRRLHIFTFRHHRVDHISISLGIIDPILVSLKSNTVLGGRGGGGGGGGGAGWGWLCSHANYPNQHST